MESALVPTGRFFAVLFVLIPVVISIIAEIVVGNVLTMKSVLMEVVSQKISVKFQDRSFAAIFVQMSVLIRLIAVSVGGDVYPMKGVSMASVSVFTAVAESAPIWREIPGIVESVGIAVRRTLCVEEANVFVIHQIKLYVMGDVWT